MALTPAFVRMTLRWLPEILSHNPSELFGRSPAITASLLLSAYSFAASVILGKATCVVLRKSQIFADPSQLAEASQFPLGEHAIERIDCVCPSKLVSIVCVAVFHNSTAVWEPPATRGPPPGT